MSLIEWPETVSNYCYDTHRIKLLLCEDELEKEPVGNHCQHKEGER